MSALVIGQPSSLPTTPFTPDDTSSTSIIAPESNPNDLPTLTKALCKDISPKLLPRFLNYRELYTFLYSNKGVDLEPVKNLISSINNEALVEIIAFILDRPIAPNEQLHLYAPGGPLFGQSTTNPDLSAAAPSPTVIRFGADNSNTSLSDLQQNVLVPGHRNQERDVVDYLGLNHGCRQQCHDSFILSALLRNLVNLSLDQLYQWDIIRIIRSRDWMDELYLGSTFRKAVMESPFRRFVQKQSKLVTLQAISLTHFRRLCAAQILKLTFGPAKDPKYQDHINLWFGTHFARPLQTLQSLFGIAQLRHSPTQISDYAQYVDYIDDCLEQICGVFGICPDIDVLTSIFNQRIPLIPLFDNHNELYVYRERDHTDSDSYDAMAEEFRSNIDDDGSQPLFVEDDFAPERIKGLEAYYNSDSVKKIKGYRKYPHNLSLNISPLIRRHARQFHQFPYNSIFAYTSRISQLKSDIENFDTKCQDIDGLKKLFTPATMLPHFLTLEELEFVLNFYQKSSLKAKEFMFLLFENLGVNYMQPTLLQQWYTVARLYDDHEVMQMLTKHGGINNDNLFTYDSKIMVPRQTQPPSFCLDPYYYPLSPTRFYPEPLTQVPVQPGDVYSYHDDPGEVKAKYDIDVQKSADYNPTPASATAKPFVWINGKKKTTITPAERVEKAITRRVTPQQLIKNIFYDAICYDLDRIVALWDTTKDYYHKTYHTSDSTSIPQKPISISSSLDEIRGLDPEHVKITHDISFATDILDFSSLPLTSACPFSTLQIAFLSGSAQMMLYKFLLSQHHGRIVTVISSKSSWYPNYICPYEIYRNPTEPRDCYGYSFDADTRPPVANKNKTDLLSLPKIQDPDDVIIIGSDADIQYKALQQHQKQQPVQKSTQKSTTNETDPDTAHTEGNLANTQGEVDGEEDQTKVNNDESSVEQDKQQEPVAEQDQTEEAQEQEQEQEQQLVMTIPKKIRLTEFEFRQYTTLSQESVNAVRQKELTRAAMATAPELLLFFVIKLLINHTQSNKSLFRPTIQLSQRVIDEINETEAADAAKKAKQKSQSKKGTNAGDPSDKPPAPKKILLPRIVKAKIDNAWFWSAIMNQSVICFHHVSLFGSKQFAVWVEIFKLFIDNDMLTLHPLTAMQRISFASDTTDPINPNGLEYTGFLPIAAVLYESVPYLVLKKDRQTMAELDALSIELLDYLLNNPIGRSYIRNGMSAFHDFAADITRPAKVKPLLSKLKDKVAAATEEPPQSRESVRNDFHSMHLNRLMDTLISISRHSPVLIKWIMDTFLPDITAAFLGGDDAIPATILPFIQHPTVFMHPGIVGGKRDLDMNKIAENKANIVPFCFQWDAGHAYVTLFRGASRQCIDAVSFMLSDYSYFPPMVDLLDERDMELAPPTLIRIEKNLLDDLSANPHFDWAARIDGMAFPDYIPMNEFNHNSARHIRAFLPELALKDQDILNCLFPYQQFAFNQQPGPSSPSTLNEGIESTDNQVIPIYNPKTVFFPHFASVISEKVVAPTFDYSLRIAMQPRCMDNELWDAGSKFLLTLRPPLRNPHNALAIALADPNPCPAIPSRCIQNFEERQFTSEDYGLGPYPLGPTFPWNMYPIMFNRSVFRDALDTGTNADTRVSSTNHTLGGREVQIELVPNHVPIARYPNLNISHDLSSGTHLDLSQAYLPQLSCVGYELCELDRLLVSQRFPLQTNEQLTALPTSAYAQDPKNTVLIDFGDFHENSNYFTFNEVTYQRVINNAQTRQFNKMHHDLMRKLDKSDHCDGGDDETTTPTYGATEIPTTLQAGVCPVPIELDTSMNSSGSYNHYVAFHYSPLSTRLSKYFDKLVTLNRQAGYSGCRALTSFDMLAQITTAVAPYVTYSFFVQPYPSLKSELKKFECSAKDKDDKELDGTERSRLLNFLDAMLSLKPDQIRGGWVADLFGDILTPHPHRSHSCPVFHLLSTIVMPLISASAPISQNSEMLQCLATLTNPIFTQPAGEHVSPTFNADLSYMSSLTQELLNCVGVFEPTQVRTIFAKYIAYMTTTTKTSHYRDGRQFASANYIQFRSGSPILSGPPNDDPQGQSSSVTWEYAKLRQEYLSFLYHSCDQKQSLPAPFSNQLYANDFNHIVNRYNRFVESELCSSPRDVYAAPTAHNRTTSSGYDPMYGTRIVFDFEQFVHNPSLGSISFVPNISTKADPTTATACMVEKYPKLVDTTFNGPPVHEVNSTTFIESDPDSFTATHNNVYILNPSTYNNSPITTPLYNRREDNILNLPQQFYHTILCYVNFSQAIYINHLLQNPSTGEYYYDEVGFDEYLNYINFVESDNISPAAIENYLSPLHRFISTSTTEYPGHVQIHELFPHLRKLRTHTFGSTTALAELFQVAKQHPITLQQCFTHFLQRVESINTKRIPACINPNSAGNNDSCTPPMTRSVRHLALVLQQFTSQPISPAIMLKAASNLSTLPVVMNLIDLCLWKTNGDLLHSLISRSYYAFANPTTGNDPLLFKNLKLHPADYHYYFSPMWSILTARYVIDRPNTMATIVQLCMKYNITTEYLHAQLLERLTTYLFPKTFLQPTDPIYAPRGVLSKRDFYQHDDNFNDFDQTPQPSSILSTILSHINPLTSPLARAFLAGGVAALAWNYYWKPQDKPKQDEVKSDYPSP